MEKFLGYQQTFGPFFGVTDDGRQMFFLGHNDAKGDEDRLLLMLAHIP